MTLHPDEEATIRSFVVPAKRDRYIALLGSRTRRRQALDDLNHFTDWDRRYCRSLPSSADIFDLLNKAGAPVTCRFISDNPELDGRELTLRAAVDAAEKCAFASILCCIPGTLAFYFDEVAAPRNRLLLERRDLDRSTPSAVDR